jgi:hypothetical protein
MAHFYQPAAEPDDLVIDVVTVKRIWQVVERQLANPFALVIVVIVIILVVHVVAVSCPQERIGNFTHSQWAHGMQGPGQYGQGSCLRSVRVL